MNYRELFKKDHEQVLLFELSVSQIYFELVFRKNGNSVVECLTQDRGVRASPTSLCCVVEQDTFILA